jgi:selenocysteine lyase/cysteine desulfurase
VPVLGGAPRRYVNLDNAASTPVLRDVLATVERFMHWYSSVHRGAGFKSRVASQAYDDARAIVARFVGARPDQHMALFGKNTTEAINLLSRRLALAADDVVLISCMEHHSNDLPWRVRAQVRHIGVDTTGRLDERHLDQLLQANAGRVRLVAITGGSNVTGITPDVHALAVKVHAVGAQIFVDCAQLAAHRAIDIGDLDDPAHLDYVAISAHKIYAPFGTGALIGRRDTFERGEPDQRGGGTVAYVSTDSVDWAAAPERDEAGTPNVVGAVALAAALQCLQAFGMAAVAEHEAELTAYALTRLARVEGIRLYGELDPLRAQHAHQHADQHAHPHGKQRAHQRLGVITFNLERHPHALVAAILSTEFGIGVRNGCFCAQPYLKRLLQIDAAQAQRIRSEICAGDHHDVPGMVRMSLALHNTAADIDALADALERIARGEFSGVYSQDRASGEYAAAGWAPDLSGYFLLGDSGDSMAAACSACSSSSGASTSAQSLPVAAGPSGSASLRNSASCPASSGTTGCSACKASTCWTTARPAARMSGRATSFGPTWWLAWRTAAPAPGA